MKNLTKRSVRAMAGYRPGEQPRRPGWVKLNTNENPYPPSPAVAKVLRAYAADELRRYPDPTCLALRARIGAIHGCGVEQVLVGNGSDEILALCTRAFVENDGRIGYFHPSYSLYPVLAQIRDVQTAPVELPPDFGWRQPPADYRAALFLLANPNAPTGIRYPRDDVAAFCRRLNGVVLIDEAYVDFARDDCMALARRFPNVLVIRTLSKSFSLAGLRLGYGVGSAALIRSLYKIKDSYNVDALTQRIALAALSDLPHVRRNAARIRATRTRLARALTGQGFQVYPSEANFVWVRPPQMPAELLFRQLRARAVLVRHFDGPRTDAYLRITVGSEADITRLLAALRAILGKRTGPTNGGWSGQRERGEAGRDRRRTGRKR